MRGWSNPSSPPVRPRCVSERSSSSSSTVTSTSTEWSAMTAIASKLGMTAETLRSWVRRAEVDQGERPGLTTDERARLKELEKENKELRRVNEILKDASIFFATELDGPTEQVVAYIAARRGRRESSRSAGPCSSLPPPTTPPDPVALRPTHPRRRPQGRDRPGARREPWRLWGRQGLAPAQPRRHPCGRCTVDGDRLDLRQDPCRLRSDRRHISAFVEHPVGPVVLADDLLGRVPASNHREHPPFAQQSGQRAPFTGGPISGGQATGSGAWTRVAMAKRCATGFG